MRRLLTVAAVLGAAVAALQDPWPDTVGAYWRVKVVKTAGLEMTDTRWGHLHVASQDATAVTFGIVVDHYAIEQFTDYATAQLKVQYTVRGVPVSPFLDPPYAFTLQLSAAELAAFESGISDVSVNVQARVGPRPPEPPCVVNGVPRPPNECEPVYTARTWPIRGDFAPYPMFLHLGGRATRTTVVPVLTQNEQDGHVESPQMDGNYVDAAALQPRGYPADPTVTPWHTAPAYAADLYQESMQPHSEQFLGAQMLWEEPPGTVDAGLRFVRALHPKASEGFIGLWNSNGQTAPGDFGEHGHRAFPVQDGPRGVGWTNGYVQGAVDAEGRLWLVNISGQLRVMHPDGELVTVVGWRVRPGKAPAWVGKTLTQIRANMEFRGTFVSGGFPTDQWDPGWHQPMDVALDPTNPDRVYVAAMYDNAIYKVDVNRTAWTGTVTLLAGDQNHAAGYVDGTGSGARFNHPFSLVASLDGRYLYVSDHDNDAIRRVEVATGAVTTAFGGPGTSQTLVGKPGVTCTVDVRLGCFPASKVRPHVRYEGADPTVYFPYSVRIASTGELVVFDRGLNSLRRFNVDTKTATVIDQLGDGAFGDWGRGWAWHDVDRWGNAGLKDGVYWGNATSLEPAPGCAPPGQPQPPTCLDAGDRFNENYRYASLDGTFKSWVFRSPANHMPVGYGPISNTRPPHYPWLMAVDPRGGVYFAGIGDHGITRLRVRKPTDPPIPNDLSYLDDYRLWNVGARPAFSYTMPPRTSVVPANPLMLWFGWGGHNYIGLPDAWAIGPNSTDADIDALFRWPAAIANDPVALASARRMVRYNRGTGGGPPPPTPVDCVVSEWGPWSAWSPWVPGPISSSGGTESRSRTRTRSILTHPSPGQPPCPALTETETETRPIVPPPPQLPAPTGSLVVYQCRGGETLKAAAAPDATTGWRAQFQRFNVATGVWVSVGTQDASVPYERAIPTLPAGPHRFRVSWTKSTSLAPLVSDELVLQCGTAPIAASAGKE